MDTELTKLQQQSTLQQSVIESLIGQLQLQIMQQAKYIEILEIKGKEMLAEQKDSEAGLLFKS